MEDVIVLSDTDEACLEFASFLRRAQVPVNVAKPLEELVQNELGTVLADRSTGRLYLHIRSGADECQCCGPVDRYFEFCRGEMRRVI